MLKIGSHVNMSGEEMFLGSVKEALSYNASAFMLYTGAPQNTLRKAVDKLKIEEAHKLITERNLSFNDIVVHAPYIVNLANPDKTKREFAVDFLTNEVIRTQALGAKQIVLHPGNHMGKGEKEGIKLIAKGLNEIITNTLNSDVVIALETMSGKGKTFAELADIIDAVAHNNRISVCFDTCHTHDYGYFVKDDFDAVVEEFDSIIGIKRIGVFHINDSKNPQGAKKDRHANVGFGFIGFPSLNYIVHYKDFCDIPKILETPYVLVENDDYRSPYLEEIRNFRNKTFEISGILQYLSP